MYNKEIEYFINLINKIGDNLKKFIKLLLGLCIVAAIISGYVQYKLLSTKSAVNEYLTVTQGVSEDTFKADSFIANLQGNKNWMISVEMEDDARTYYYYLNDDNKVVLESYVESGIENVLNQVMN